jgi:hypothetical protein
MLTEMPIPRLEMLAAMSGVGVFGLIMMLPFAPLARSAYLFARRHGSAAVVAAAATPSSSRASSRSRLACSPWRGVHPAGRRTRFSQSAALLAYVTRLHRADPTAFGVLIARGLFALRGARTPDRADRGHDGPGHLCLANPEHPLGSGRRAHTAASPTWRRCHGRELGLVAGTGCPRRANAVSGRDVACLGLFLLTTHGLATG